MLQCIGFPNRAHTWSLRAPVTSIIIFRRTELLEFLHDSLLKLAEFYGVEPKVLLEEIAPPNGGSDEAHAEAIPQPAEQPA